MKYTFLAIVISLVTSCHKKELIIKPLSPYISKGLIGLPSHALYKFKYYYTEDYDTGDSIQRNFIKEFAIKNLDKDYKDYNQYQISIYRKTNELNDEFVDKESASIAWHQDDLLFIFYWTDGVYLSYTELKDGQIIEPKKEVTR